MPRSKATLIPNRSVAGGFTQPRVMCRVFLRGFVSTINTIEFAWSHQEKPIANTGLSGNSYWDHLNQLFLYSNSSLFSFSIYQASSSFISSFIMNIFRLLGAYLLQKVSISNVLIVEQLISPISLQSSFFCRR